jgi:DNA-binding NtrC family response regulator
MLANARIFILEDEAIPALDLAIAVETAGGIVIGPAGTIAAALALLDEQDVSAAILDANLPDGELTPVALRLLNRGIPFIVHTGVGAPEELRQRYPDVPVYVKPTDSDRLVDAISALLIQQQPASPGMPCTVSDLHLPSLD